MIEVKNLKKSFKVTKRNAGLKESFRSFFASSETVQALNDISFHIKEGEIVAYIGPNGSGKSTTIKILSGILTPDSGECFINGRVPWLQRNDHVKEIGVVFGQRSQLWWDVPVIDSFELLKDIYEINDEDYQTRLNELIDLLKLEEILKTPTRQLSLGQRMRCEIASSLLHNPKILFLDEPTIGLDAISKIAIRQFIKDLNVRFHTTIILTTHDMQDVEALAQRVIFIGKGTILFDGSFDDIRHYFGHEKIMKLEYKGHLPKIANVTFVQDNGNQALLKISDQSSLNLVLNQLSQSLDIINMTIEDEDIDVIVSKLYQEFQVVS